MKFIKLRHGNDEKITYTVRIDSIACIETYVDIRGKVFTYITSENFEDGRLYVKETEEEILNALQLQQTIDQFLKQMR